MAVERGERLSELELPDSEFGIESGIEAIVERLLGYRVDFAREAKLVSKRKQ